MTLPTDIQEFLNQLPRIERNGAAQDILSIPSQRQQVDENGNYGVDPNFPAKSFMIDVAEITFKEVFAPTAMNAPDFSRLEKTYPIISSFDGKLMTAEVFLSNDGKYRYTFVRDGHDRVFLQDLQSTDLRLSSYGVPLIHIVASKEIFNIFMPINEYPSQIMIPNEKLAQPSKELDNDYSDAFPTILENHPFIRD